MALKDMVKDLTKERLSQTPQSNSGVKRTVTFDNVGVFHLGWTSVFLECFGIKSGDQVEITLKKVKSKSHD